MFQVSYLKHTLQFTFEAGTSRGVLTERDTYYIRLWDSDSPECAGIGECAPLRGLSIDDVPEYEQRLQELCNQINRGDFVVSKDTILQQIGNEWPSIQCGVETAWLDWYQGGQRRIFDTPFSRSEAGIEINGLIWMGNERFMREQIEDKLKAGFRCLKIKIGAIDFKTECTLLASIRKDFPANQITLRVDANGAFAPAEAQEKLKRLADYELHSIEQPIKAGQIDAMAELCVSTPLPIALDEELIGISEPSEKQKLLQIIRPQYIIVKPSLVGGFQHSQEWIMLAEQQNIGWWITSALESNIGLNAIAQFTASLNNPLPQGLGTGQLYHNNISSPLEIRNGFLHSNKNGIWEWPGSWVETGNSTGKVG